MPRVVVVLGTRPEMTKLSPVLPRLGAEADLILVHTGQHYSYEMDRLFFEELALPEPQHALRIGSGSHAEQVGGMLPALEKIALEDRADAVVVLGDTNSTFAGALAAVKVHVPVIHIEAGCRSDNREMPEEINRVLVDRCANLHLAPDAVAVANLRAEGYSDATIRLVGSTSVDAARLHAARAVDRLAGLRARFDLTGDYAVATVHRAENTVPEVLGGIFAALADVSDEIPIVLPLHPRTRGVGVALPVAPDVRVTEPLGYLDMLALVAGARLILTDSGGLQEEAPGLGTPAVVMRRETEWTELLGSQGNVLAGSSRDEIVAAARQVLDRTDRRIDLPHLEERVGAADRVVDAILGFLQR